MTKSVFVFVFFPVVNLFYQFDSWDVRWVEEEIVFLPYRTKQGLLIQRRDLAVSNLISYANFKPG